MIDYREIIRLKSADYSNTSVASSAGNCRSLVSEVWTRAQKNNLSWPLPSTLTNEILKQVLYPEKADAILRMPPDYEHIHKELAKPGVTLTLLWSEYRPLHSIAESPVTFSGKGCHHLPKRVLISIGILNSCQIGEQKIYIELLLYGNAGRTAELFEEKTILEFIVF